MNNFLKIFVLSIGIMLFSLSCKKKDPKEKAIIPVGIYKKEDTTIIVNSIGKNEYEIKGETKDEYSQKNFTMKFKLKNEKLQTSGLYTFINIENLLDFSLDFKGTNRIMEENNKELKIKIEDLKDNQIISIEKIKTEKEKIYDLSITFHTGHFLTDKESFVGILKK